MNEEFNSWVKAHINEDPSRLRLSFAGKKGDIDYADAITQIECRKKFGKKLADTLASYPDFRFPSVLAGEQATADIVAEFHSSLVAEGVPACDLTAGLGIDAFHCSHRASEVVAVELDNARAEALKTNAHGLKIDNIEVVEADCRDYIRECVAEGRHFATVFIDPARRATDGSRVFALSDCEPDVTALMPDLARICDLLIIKASPMLDVAHTANAITPAPVAIMCVGTSTECKELLVMVNFAAEAAGDTMIEAVTLRGEGADTFAFTAEQESDCPAPEAMLPLKAGDYVYESSPALMKSGAFKLLAQRFGLKGFHANTRLFASEDAVEDFPGTRYRVIESLPYASRVIKRLARTYPKLNVAVRNFGLGADALRSRLGVRDGGNLRLFGLTDARNEKVLVVAEPC